MVAPSSYVKVSGTYKKINKMYVNVSGTWKEITNGYVRVSGVWKKIHQASFGNDAFTKILLHMEGANSGTTFTDDNAGGSSHTWTSVGAFAVTSTTTKKFGSTSMWGLPVNGGCITTPDHADFTLGSGNWTLDLWFNRAGETGARGLCGQIASNFAANNSPIAVLTDASNHLQASVSNGSALTVITGSTSITDSAWHHLALVRNGGTVTMYLDGAVEASSSFSGTLPDSTASWAFGRMGDRTTNQDWGGYIDEARLSVGVARWTAAFTPPTAAYF